MAEISPEDLVDCTAELSARYSVGVWPQASFATISNKAGTNLDNVAISQTTAPSDRYKKIESFGGQLR